MVPRIHAGGKSFGGIVDYLTHDARTPDDPHPTTGERVGWYSVENLSACQPREAAAVMRGTARDAAVLKELAGGSAKGRALTKPVYHYSLSWARDERPTRDDMLTAASESLKKLGMSDRQALIVQHTDRAHAHCHIVVNRVSPEDGRAASRTHDARALSAWARTWERERGGVRCQRRPTPPVERAVSRVVQLLKRSEPAPPQPRRGPGRPGRDRHERQEWAALYDRQRFDAKDQASGRALETISSDPHHRIERRELAQQQAVSREQSYVSAERKRYDSTRKVNFNSGLVPANDLAAREVEPRLPHVGGVLAVSDRTLLNLIRAENLDLPARSALVTIYSRHRDDAPAREQAEGVYHRPVINQQQTKAQRHQTREYRVGARESPTTPMASWDAARVAVTHAIVAHVRKLVERTFREVAMLRERVTQQVRDTLDRAARWADRSERWAVHGQDRRTLGPDEPREHNPLSEWDQDRARLEREREDRDQDRDQDRDFGPSR